MVQISSLIAIGLVSLSVSASPIANQKGQAPAAPKAGAAGASAPKAPAGHASAGTHSGTTGHVKTSKVASTKKKVAPHPNHMKGLPAGTHILAFDEAKGKLHAFDKAMKPLGTINAVGKGGKPIAPKGEKADAKGSGKGGAGASAPAGNHKPGTSKAPPSKMIHQKRDDPSACTPLSSDDVQKLPGWQAIKSAAEAAWGTGSYNIVANDKDYPDYPATACVDTNPSMITVNGKPACSSIDSNLKGTLANDGTTAVTHQFGTTSETSMTVTKESSMSVGASLTASFGLPGVDGAEATASWEATMTNSLAKGTTASTNTMESHTITMNDKGGQGCSLSVTTKNCNIQGTGKVRVAASGWVWFEYNDRTQGHYKWAMSIDNTVKNIDDRSSFMEYRAQVTSKTTSDYKGTCTVVSDKKA